MAQPDHIDRLLHRALAVSAPGVPFDAIRLRSSRRVASARARQFLLVLSAALTLALPMLDSTGKLNVPGAAHGAFLAHVLPRVEPAPAPTIS